MVRVLDSFKVRSGNKFLDYRLGKDLDLFEIKTFFQKQYQVKKLWKEPRHVLGILAKDGREYFLKLATSEGITVVTRNEYYWNDYYNNYSSNSKYLVPKNYKNGLYKNKYFYLITDYFNGKLLCEIRDASVDISDLVSAIPQIIEIFEIIKRLPQVNFAESSYENTDYRNRFLKKTHNWFTDIPDEITDKFNVTSLLDIVNKGVSYLFSQPRHGDFTPWHMIRLADNRLGLIDGEHALSESVEGYDICYFIQRVFSVLRNPPLAEDIYSRLNKKGYSTGKLKTVLAARAIGGFLDESLTAKQNYTYAALFKEWVEKLS